jgi:hypothetical protein
MDDPVAPSDMKEGTMPLWGGVRAGLNLHADVKACESSRLLAGRRCDGVKAGGDAPSTIIVVVPRFPAT